jgi:hypothetical protein
MPLTSRSEGNMRGSCRKARSLFSANQKMTGMTADSFIVLALALRARMASERIESV